MDFFRRTKGVISVFLIIIMLPLLTSAVILVDGTRYHSAKTMVQKAGDLAAYSTIANYNQDLKLTAIYYTVLLTRASRECDAKA